MGQVGQRKNRRNALTPLAGLCIILCLSVVVSGCGYTYATSRLSDEYATIAVPTFKNESFEPDIQILVTNLLVRELMVDGRLGIVDDPAMADLVLDGAITDFEARAISYSTEDEIGQFKIAILGRASLTDTRTGKVIWQKDSLRGGYFYQTRGGRTREEALERLENLVETLIFECFDSYW